MVSKSQVVEDQMRSTLKRHFYKNLAEHNFEDYFRLNRCSQVCLEFDLGLTPLAESPCERALNDVGELPFESEGELSVAFSLGAEGLKLLEEKTAFPFMRALSSFSNPLTITAKTLSTLYAPPAGRQSSPTTFFNDNTTQCKWA